MRAPDAARSARGGLSRRPRADARPRGAAGVDALRPRGREADPRRSSASRPPRRPAAEPEAALPAAAALELVHAFSLVHDDLPALDDDDERRGRPSAHVAFGEGVALLAGDALLVGGVPAARSPTRPPEVGAGARRGDARDDRRPVPRHHGRRRRPRASCTGSRPGRLFAASVGLGLRAAGGARGRPGAVARVRRGARDAVPGRGRHPRRRRVRRAARRRAGARRSPTRAAIACPRCAGRDPGRHLGAGGDRRRASPCARPEAADVRLKPASRTAAVRLQPDARVRRPEPRDRARRELRRRRRRSTDHPAARQPRRTPPRAGGPGSATSAVPRAATAPSSRASSWLGVPLPRRGRRQRGRGRTAPARRRAGRPSRAARSRRRSPFAAAFARDELDRLGRPVGREHVGARERGREATAAPGRSRARARAGRRGASADHVPRERDAARPQLGPVGQELVLARSAPRRSGAPGSSGPQHTSSCRPIAIRSSRMRLACQHDEEAARRAARGARARGVAQPGAGARDRRARPGLRQARARSSTSRSCSRSSARLGSSPAAARSSRMRSSCCRVDPGGQGLPRRRRLDRRLHRLPAAGRRGAGDRARRRLRAAPSPAARRRSRDGARARERAQRSRACRSPPSSSSATSRSSRSKTALPPLLRLAAPGWEALVLVKPQFEAGRADAPKGVVRDPEVRRRVLHDVCARGGGVGLAGRGRRRLRSPRAEREPGVPRPPDRQPGADRSR